MDIAKQGDKIQWSFEKDHRSPLFRGKTFTANVVVVFHKEKEYGVYAEYGQDKIPFNQATIIKRKEASQ